MEKKRKRASFSPEMPNSITATVKPKKEEPAAPVLTQVVEVLGEESKQIPEKATEQVVVEKKMEPIPEVVIEKEAEQPLPMTSREPEKNFQEPQQELEQELEQPESPVEAPEEKE